MGKQTNVFLPPVTEIPVGVIPEGKVFDFFSGSPVNDTPEEYVRQNLEKALVRQYRYSAHDCATEFLIRVGASKKRLDIAVFKPGSPHLQANIAMILETKRAGTNSKNKDDGIGQLESYMASCPNALYGLWTNGDERYCFVKRAVEGVLSFDPIVDIPLAGQQESEIQRPKRKDLMPAAADNLLFAFRRCHNYIAGTQGMHKPAAFWELLKLIFCKIEDERSGVLQFYATPTELLNATSGAATKSRIQLLFENKVLGKYTSIFPSGDREIGLHASVVAYVVSQLQRYSLLASPVDVKGVAYEEIVGSNLRGDRGEFFTPRNACRMAVTMLNPRPSDRIFDPACGTGGFLITAMNHALAHIDQEERGQWEDPAYGSDAERQELYRKRSEYLRTKVNGFDLNPALVRAAKMNMVMNNDGEGGLFQTNSLSNPHSWDPLARLAVPLGSIDLLFTNPPFGANIVIDDTEVLSQYDLACVWDRTAEGDWSMRLKSNGERILQRSQPPEVLFVERCLQFLIEGTGRMAMVIPNGILNNPALGYLRQWLLRNAQIIAVVDMARDLFQPKNDTQTSMVLMRRLSREERALANQKRLDYPIFMAVTHRIGHDKRGNAVYKRSPDGKEVIVRKTEETIEIDPTSGLERVRKIEITDRALDDELPEVATAFRLWLVEQQQ